MCHEHHEVCASNRNWGSALTRRYQHDKDYGGHESACKYPTAPSDTWKPRFYTCIVPEQEAKGLDDDDTGRLESKALFRRRPINKPERGLETDASCLYLKQHVSRSLQ
jgi:hypothetical protein